MNTKAKNFDLRYGTLFVPLRVGYRQQEEGDQMGTRICVEYETGEWFCDCGMEGDVEAEKRAKLIVKWSRGKLGKRYG